MTRGRIIGFILVAAFAALIVFVANRTYWKEISIPMPVKGEAAQNPFYAAQRFSEKLGAQTRWIRALVAPPPPSAVMVISTWHWSLSAARRQRLERWVESGGRLVVDHSLVGGEEDFERWTGIAREFIEEHQDRKKSAEDYAACRDFNSSDGPFYLCDFDRDSHFTSHRKIAWALRDATGMQVVRINIGRGSITAINATPFRFRALFEGDHARLFVAATQLQRGDQVYFLSEDDHPSLLTLLWGFGAPVVMLGLVLVALALWRGAVRFGPLTATPALARRSLAEQIRGTGQFAMRFGGGAALHSAAVRALNEIAERRISSYPRLSTEDRVTALARAGGVDAEALKSALHFSGPRRSHELRSALALLDAARRQISIQTQRS